LAIIELITAFCWPCCQELSWLESGEPERNQTCFVQLPSCPSKCPKGLGTPALSSSISLLYLRVLKQLQHLGFHHLLLQSLEVFSLQLQPACEVLRFQMSACYSHAAFSLVVASGFRRFQPIHSSTRLLFALCIYLFQQD
jgi:hypothetical protein